MASKENEVATADASEVLPPELFPYIASALVRARSRKTLLNMVCASQRMFVLCFPVLMSEIDLGAPNDDELEDWELRQRSSGCSC